MSKAYLALIKLPHTAGDSVLHLIRDDAEASLCGVPESSLTHGGMFDSFVCAACLEWFEKRRAAGGTVPPANRSA